MATSTSISILYLKRSEIFAPPIESLVVVLFVNFPFLLFGKELEFQYLLDKFKQLLEFGMDVGLGHPLISYKFFALFLRRDVIDRQRHCIENNKVETNSDKESLN